MVVGQYFGEVYLLYSVHGDTIHQTVCLISTACIEIQAPHKRLVRLWPDGHRDVGQNGPNRLEGFATEIRATSSIGREELYQHFLGRHQMHRPQRRDRPLRGGMPGVAWRNTGYPVQRIRKDLLHRLGVP